MSDSIRHTNSSWIMAPGLDTLASAIAEAIPAPTSLNTTMEQMLKKRKTPGYLEQKKSLATGV